jgi:hypothetical protein
VARSRLRQVKYLNNIVEQDHRNVKASEATGAWLWRLLDCPTNAGRLRGDGHVSGKGRLAIRPHRLPVRRTAVFCLAEPAGIWANFLKPFGKKAKGA